ALAFASCTKEDDDPPPPPPPVNAQPSLSITTPAVGQLGDVTLDYTLTDAESDSCTIAVEFSIDGGTNFSAATEGTGGDGTTALTSSPGGTAHTFVWDSVTDGVGTTAANTTVQIRITPSDAAAGTADTTGDFTVDNTGNTPPSVSVTTPAGTESGLVTISYTLTDPESQTCSISAEFSTDGGTNYGPATCFCGDGVSGLTSSPGGTAHMVIWNSFADGVATSAVNTTVRVRIIPCDTLPGTAGATGDFTVDNTAVSAGDTIGGLFPIQYDVTSPPWDDDYCEGIAADDAYMYLVGRQDWHIQKRRLDDGSLDTGFGTNGTITALPSGGQAGSIAIDSTYMYVAGRVMVQPSPHSSAWRIEKRLLTTGALETGFGTVGVVTTAGLGDVLPPRIVIDGSSMYLTGSEEVTLGTFDMQFRLEKRSLSDGSLQTAFGTNGVIANNFNANVENYFRAMPVGSSVYLVGFRDVDVNNLSTSGGEGVIEKRDATTGALDTGFGTNGVVLSDASAGIDVAAAIANDGTYLYVIVFSETGLGAGSFNWRIEKRNLSDGSLVTSTTAAGALLQGLNLEADIAVKGSFLFVGGRDGTTDYQWRVEKRALSDLSLDTGFASSGVYTSNPSASEDVPYSLLVTGGVLYVVGMDRVIANNDGQWRIEALYR
ncbi:MAG: hypothetical protein ACYTHN_13225, partial [Planctomycetota bacterium]